jgi:hypothetical protein
MLLKDFYRDTVDLNDSLKGGWGNLYYGVFSDVIREHNYKNIAEIGIGYGTHAKYILKNNDIEKLYLIDPMKKYENDGFVDDILKHETSCSPCFLKICNNNGLCMEGIKAVEVLKYCI